MSAVDLIVGGASLGGLEAFENLLAGLPPEFVPPVVLVQHRPAGDGNRLLELLQKETLLPVSEAVDKEELSPRHVYLAPPDYHLLLDGTQFALSTEEPVHHARPSIDVLFESAAIAYAEGVVGVLLTGSGRDGASGLAKIKALGGTAVVQEPETTVSNGMPRAALGKLAVDQVLPLAEIAPFLASLVTRQGSRWTP